MTVEFLITSLVVVLIPGTGVIYTLTTGLSQGGRAGILAAFGCTLGIVPHLVASLTGLATLLHVSSVLFETVRYLGVAYLLYMAWATLRDNGSFDLKKSEAVPQKDIHIVRNAVLLNILNPKLSLFFLAFLPQFIPADAASPERSMFMLAAVFMIMTFIVFAGYGLFAAAARKHVMNRPRVLQWFRRGFAATFGALGARLALSD